MALIDSIGNGSSGSYEYGKDESTQSQPEIIQKSETPPISAIPKKNTIHRYPIFMDGAKGTSADDKSHIETIKECIHFTAVKQGGISFQKNANAKAKQRILKKNQGIFDRALGIVNSAEENLNLTAKENEERFLAAESIVNKFDGKRSNITNDTATLSQGIFDGINDQLKNTRQEEEALEHCFLYMPNAVSFNETHSWGAEELGAVGNLINNAARNGKGGTIGDTLKEFGIGSAAELAKGAAVAGGAAVGGLLGALGAASLLDGAGAGIKAAGRFVQNPYEEQLFNGIGFREFSFDFVFAASNEDEYRQVEGIINMFRLHSKPSYTVEGSTSLYTFPNEFKIDFKRLKNDGSSFETNKSLPKIHNCVCTNVATNYTPDGKWIAHSDGRSISTTLTLSFTETAKITQNEVIGGY